MPGLALMLSCSACGNEPPAKLPVPPEYLSCAAEPVPGEPEGTVDPKTGKRRYTDAQAANYLIDALEAGADCRNKVAAIRAWDAEK